MPNIEEIRKNAPSGATHYYHDDAYVFYYRKIGSIWYEVTINGNNPIDKSLVIFLKPL